MSPSGVNFEHNFDIYILDHVVVHSRCNVCVMKAPVWFKSVSNFLIKCQNKSPKYNDYILFERFPGIKCYKSSVCLEISSTAFCRYVFLIKSVSVCLFEHLELVNLLIYTRIYMNRPFILPSYLLVSPLSIEHAW